MTNVSDNDRVMTKQECSHGKQRTDKCVSKQLHKTGSDGADTTCCGTLFEMQSAATEDT